MSSKVPPSDLPNHAFSNAAELESFLEQEHTIAPGFYLKLAKKSSGIASVSAAEAVEVALCFGWIDGRADGIDENWWLVRYTPRRPKSLWSKKNVNTIERLTEQGRMRPAGLAAVEAAKADGRWGRAYAGPATIAVADDLAAALAANPAAAAFFEAMNKSDRYALLWRVETASPSSRAKRIQALVDMVAAGQRPGTTVKPASKPKITKVQKTTARRAAAKKQPSTSVQLETVIPTPEKEARQSRREGLRRRP
jgi:uncharacterized protein YdeI (YjbR/CyaY-like superfamily)